MGKLSEIYFEKSKKGNIEYLGFCHVNKSEYKTKKEQDYIKHDTAKFRLSFRDNKYKMMTT
jgi:hypothetical protein